MNTATHIVDVSVPEVSAVVSAEVPEGIPAATVAPTASPAPANPPQTISDDQEKRAIEALRTLHSIFHTHTVNGKAVEIPEFSKCSREDLEKVCIKAMNGLARKEKYRREALFRDARKAVADKVAEARTAGLEARRTIDNLRATMPEAAWKVLAQSVPSVVRIPMSELLSVFPTGTTKEAMVKELVALKYSLEDGRGKKDDKCLLVSLLPPATVPVPPPAQQNA